MMEDHSNIALLPAEEDAAHRAVALLTRPIRQSTKLSKIVSPPDPPGELLRFMRLPEVMNRVGLKRAAIYHHMGKGTFPRQVALSDQAVAWIESEIEAWIEARIQARAKKKS